MGDIATDIQDGLLIRKYRINNAPIVATEQGWYQHKLDQDGNWVEQIYTRASDNESYTIKRKYVYWD